MQIFITIILIFFILSPAQGEIINGKVEYSVNSAREELLNSSKQYIPCELIKSNIIDLNANIKDRTIGKFSDNSYAVIYKNDPLHVWYYSPVGTLTHCEIKSSLTYPYKTYKYSTDNKLINMSLRVSKDETFIYTPEGKLIAHWIGKNCFDENNNIIMTRQILE